MRSNYERSYFHYRNNRSGGGTGWREEKSQQSSSVTTLPKTIYDLLETPRRHITSNKHVPHYRLQEDCNLHSPNPDIRTDETFVNINKRLYFTNPFDFSLKGLSVPLD